MRELQTHKINAANKKIDVRVIPGISNDVYKVIWTNLAGEERIDRLAVHTGDFVEDGVTGLTNEVLLAIVADRLRTNTNGKRRPVEAINCIEELLKYLGD